MKQFEKEEDYFYLDNQTTEFESYSESEEMSENDKEYLLISNNSEALIETTKNHDIIKNSSLGSHNELEHSYINNITELDL